MLILVLLQVVQPGFGTPVRQGGGNIASGTAMAFAPDGRIFVAQQTGQVRIINGGSINPANYLALSVNSADERGLLGIAFDPQYSINGWFYVFYTLSGSNTNRVARYQVSADPQISGTSEDVLLDIPTGSLNPQYHNGGALHFGPDGKLYVAVGEGHSSSNAQNPANIYGKILRLNPDGSIPADNPTSFQGIAGTFPVSAVWCVGLRNPFTFAFHPNTGRMFINDVGQNEWEEINDGIQGRNYGWNGGTTDGRRMSASFTDSVYEYPHSGATPPIGNVITGGAFYAPDVVAYPASYLEQYFFADVGSGNFIYALNPATGAVAPFVTSANNPVDLDVGPDGALYYLARGGANPGVYRVPYTGVISQGIVISTETVSVNEGATGGFNVRLAVDPGAGNTVTVDVAKSLGDASVTVTPPALSFTSGTWSVNQPVTVTAAQDNGDTSDDGATISLSAPGLTTRTVVVTAVDNDDNALAPVVRIAQPLNGETVSGTTAEFYGHATDDAGATGAAQFFIDGVLVYTDPLVLGHYHFGGGHSNWNTTGLSNGPHVLQMRVSDGTNVGIHEITVIVSNGAGGGGGGSSGGGGCGLSGLELLLLGLLRRRKC